MSSLILYLKALDILAMAFSEVLRELPGRPWAQLFEVKKDEKVHAMEAVRDLFTDIEMSTYTSI